MASNVNYVASLNHVPQYVPGMNFKMYEKELRIWNISTNVANTKKASHVILYSLPKSDESRIREKVLRDFEIKDLEKEDGLESLITYLKKHLAKDAMTLSWAHYREYENYKRGDESIIKYVSHFDHLYKQVETSGDVSIPPFFLACKLIYNANLTEDETMIVMTAIDTNKKDDMYEDAKKSLLKFKGGLMNSSDSEGASGSYSLNRQTVKQEPAEVLLSEDQKCEEAYIAGYNRARGFRGYGARGYGGNSVRGVMRGTGYMQNYRGNGQPNYRGNYNWRAADSGRGSNFNSGRESNWRGDSTQERRAQRPLNPPGYNGEPILCKQCGSYRHVTKDCKNTSQNVNALATDGQPSKCNACGSFRHYKNICTESWEYINSQAAKINICDYVPGSESPYSDGYDYSNYADQSGGFEGQF